MPAATAVARPALLIVAVAGVTDVHVAEFVRFCVLLSLYVPVAVNCCVAPLAIEGVAGVTAIDTSVAAVTVKTVEPLIAARARASVDAMLRVPLDARRLRRAAA